MSDTERSFARVDTALKGYLRLLPPGRLIPLFNSAQMAPVSQPADTALAGLPDTLMPYLRGMNEKLNTILALLNQQSLQEDFSVPVVVHDISGAGLRFSAGQRFELGQGVEIVVVLGGQPGRDGSQTQQQEKQTAHDPETMRRKKVSATAA